MSVETAIVACVALGIGLAAGFVLARARAAPPPAVAPPPPPEAAGLVEEDTKPTLVPFRATREAGRSAARLDQQREVDAILADLGPDDPSTESRRSAKPDP
jgi:hypothetical protein